MLLPLGLHREERNPSFSVCYVCIFTCSRVVGVMTSWNAKIMIHIIGRTVRDFYSINQCGI